MRGSRQLGLKRRRGLHVINGTDDGGRGLTLGLWEGQVVGGGARAGTDGDGACIYSSCT